MISAGATETLPETKATRKPDAETISSWSYDMEGHGKQCVERYCEFVLKFTYLVLILFDDDWRCFKLCLATSDSCQAKSASVLFLVDTVWTVPVLSTGDEQLMLSSAVCLVQVAIGTSGACCLCSFSCCQLILCTRLCVHDSWYAAHNGSRKPHMSISSHMVTEPVFVHGNTVTWFGEPSGTDGGSVGCGTTSKSSNFWGCSAGGENMSSWYRCGRDWETRDVQWRWRLERSSQQHALVSLESHCSKLLWKAQPDGDPVAAACGNKTWKIRSSPTTRRWQERRDDFQHSCTVCLHWLAGRALQVVQQVPRG